MKLKKILIITTLISLMTAFFSCVATDDKSLSQDSISSISTSSDIANSTTESFLLDGDDIASESKIEQSETKSEFEESYTESKLESQTNESQKESVLESSAEESQLASDTENKQESELNSETESEFESTTESELEDDSLFEDNYVPNVDDLYLLEPDDKYVAIDIQNKISTEIGKMSFITKSSYKGIKRIIFDARTGEINSWWGIAITTNPKTASVYNVDLTAFGTNGYWSTFVFEFDGTGCTTFTTSGEFHRKVSELKTVPYDVNEEYYIYFTGPLYETFSEPLCIDNFVIELTDGSCYTDTFTDGANNELFNADKAVTHVIDTTNTPTPSNIPETPLYESNEMFYQCDDVIDFTAYAPVTIQNWAGLGTPNPNLVTDTQYRYMAEAGFTKSLGLYEGRTGNSGLTYNEKAEKDALTVLEIAEKYGIKYYVLNERFYNFVRPDINLEFFDLTKINGTYYNSKGEEVSDFDSYKYLKSNWKQLYQEKISQMFSSTNKYIDKIAYAGNFASDEPPLPLQVDGKWYYGELEQLYYQLSIYYKYVTANSLYGGEAYVNLNPYGSPDPYTRERYDAMMDYYCKNIAPMLGYVSYDQYPLNYSNTAYVNSTHLLNLEIMANYCKQYNLELRSFIWAKSEQGHSHRAIIRTNDLRFQAYANLAFGVKEMPYYTYTNYYTAGSNACDSLIDFQSGKRTKLYYWTKEVNNEIHSLEKAYLNFKWEGSMYFDVGAKSHPLSLLETNFSSHKRLTSISGNTDVLVGVFSDSDGLNNATDGFIFMNYSDPYYSATGTTNNVVLNFSQATHAIVYKNGKQYVAQLENGQLSMCLEAGEGVFVVPFVQ